MNEFGKLATVSAVLAVILDVIGGMLLFLFFLSFTIALAIWSALLCEVECQRKEKYSEEVYQIDPNLEYSEEIKEE